MTAFQRTRTWSGIVGCLLVILASSSAAWAVPEDAGEGKVLVSLQTNKKIYPTSDPITIEFIGDNPGAIGHYFRGLIASVRITDLNGRYISVPVNQVGQTDRFLKHHERGTVAVFQIPAYRVSPGLYKANLSFLGTYLC